MKNGKVFGWVVKEVDGNDVESLSETLGSVPFEEGKPSLIISHTTKMKDRGKARLFAFCFLARMGKNVTLQCLLTGMEPDGEVIKKSSYEGRN